MPETVKVSPGPSKLPVRVRCDERRGHLHRHEVDLGDEVFDENVYSFDDHLSALFTLRFLFECHLSDRK